MSRWAVVGGIVLAAMGCGGDDGSACVPGISQACVGVGGCAGGQVCLPDGSGFGACDCEGDADAGVDAPDAPDSGTDAADDTSSDTPIDADPDSCDPIVQSGCGADEKCSWRVEDDATFEGRTTCVPEGSVDVDGACEYLAAAEGGYDDCVAGAWCVGGACTPVCDDADDMCPEGSSCQPYAGIFDDRENIGGCTYTCDLLGSDCMDGEGCYMNYEGEAFCGAPAAETAGQGEACEFINSCEIGSGCWLDRGDGVQRCAYLCDPAAGGGPGCDDATGPGTTHTCVAITTFYAGGLPEEIGDDIGFCIECGVDAEPGTRGCPP